jgi:hypothetical protein
MSMNKSIIVNILVILVLVMGWFTLVEIKVCPNSDGNQSNKELSTIYINANMTIELIESENQYRGYKNYFEGGVLIVQPTKLGFPSYEGFENK